MSKEVIITNYKNKELIACLENNKAIEMFLKFPDSIEIGDIYIGKVKNIVENIQAAFIEVSPGIIGYYSLKNNTHHLFTRPTQRKLSVGDEIVVQVERGSIKSKAPVLTSRIQIQGEHMVLLANYHFTGTIGVEEGVQQGNEAEHRNHQSDQLPAFPAFEQQMVGSGGCSGICDISRVLDHHTEADGTQEEHKVHQRVAPGKGITVHNILQKKKSPKMGTFCTKE